MNHEDELLVTGTAGVSPAMSAKRELPNWACYLGKIARLRRVAGGTPAVPVITIFLARTAAA